MTRYVPVIWDIETTGLNPMAEDWWNNSHAAQVVAVGVATIPNWREASGPDDAIVNTYTYYDSDEYRLLEVIPERIHEVVIDDYIEGPFEVFTKVQNTKFITRSGQNPQGVLIGFNSRSFDHTYMGARFSRKRINGWPITHGWKRLDMQRVAGHHGELTNYPKQDDYAEYHGVDVPDEHDGSQMPKYFKDGKMSAIREHAEADVEELARLFMADREAAMEEFYDHYGIDAEPNFVDEVDL